MAQLRKEQDRYSEALEYVDRALALDPRNPQAQYLRGCALAPMGFNG